QTTSTPNPSTPNNTKSTHVAAMIYYRKTLFGSGPKLTAVHKEMQSMSRHRLMRLNKEGPLKRADTGGIK
ncbi:hypothetical protein, partial [Polynucleobacter arcticus]|uniref:hypothetical protein n=1 Tax=Polynucleobacter arcticus TaxID=1743165 RepID=UPI0039EEB21D